MNVAVRIGVRGTKKILCSREEYYYMNVGHKKNTSRSARGYIFAMGSPEAPRGTYSYIFGIRGKCALGSVVKGFSDIFQRIPRKCVLCNVVKGFSDNFQRIPRKCVLGNVFVGNPDILQRRGYAGIFPKLAVNRCKFNR